MVASYVSILRTMLKARSLVAFDSGTEGRSASHLRLNSVRYCLCVRTKWRNISGLTWTLKQNRECEGDRVGRWMSLRLEDVQSCMCVYILVQGRIWIPYPINCVCCLGDLGYADHDGHVVITDRLKELIKYKGLQVKPRIDPTA